MALVDENRSELGPSVDRAFVIIACVATAVAALWYVLHFGRNVPYMEDWELVAVYSGRRPATVGWLVEQMLEHRYILPKAVMYAVWSLTHDFRASMLVDLAAIVAVAIGFVRAATRLRGRWSYADAFFPVAFLHFGHYENLIFSTQLYYVLPIALFALALFVVVVGEWETTLGAATLGAAIALLPLNGGIGLVLAPPLVVWAIVVGVVRYQEERDGRTPAILLGAAGVTVASTALYFLHFQRLAPTGAIPRTPATIRRTILQVFSIGLGPEGRNLWPWSALLSVLICSAAGVLLVVAVVRSSDRLRAAGLLACLSAAGLLLCAIGYGRAQVLDVAGFPSHYAWLAVLPLCCAYYAFVGYGGPVARRLVPALVFGVAVAMYGAGAHEGLDYGKSLAAAEDGLLSDVVAGMPPEAIAQRYSPRLYPNRAAMAGMLGMLRDAGSGPYKGLEHTSPSLGAYREVTVPISVVSANQARVDGGVVHGTGPDPYLIYALPEATYVCGVRFDYEVTNAVGVAPQTQVFWSLSGRNDFDAGVRNVFVEADAEKQAPTVWVFDTIDRLRLDPDTRPCDLRLRSITLLVPA